MRWQKENVKKRQNNNAKENNENEYFFVKKGKKSMKVTGYWENHIKIKWVRGREVILAWCKT